MIAEIGLGLYCWWKGNVDTCLTRLIAIVLASLLLMWGAIATPAAAKQALPKAEWTSTADDWTSGCDDAALNMAHGDHHNQSGQPGGDDADDKAHSQRGCCLTACGATAIEPVAPLMVPMGVTSLRTSTVLNDLLRDRSVSPRLRPPRCPV